MPLFVYGTLKPGEANYPRYLAGRSSAVRPASVSGAGLFTEGQYPYLLIDPDTLHASEHVYGALITIRSEVYYQTLIQIDQLEDYNPGNPWSLYERVVHRVQTDAGLVEAWVYVAGSAARTAIKTGRLVKIAGGIWRMR